MKKQYPYSQYYPEQERGLTFLYTDVLLINATPTDVESWNLYFDLPTRGKPFTSVIVEGNRVKLFGGNITEFGAGFPGDELNQLIEMVDYDGLFKPTSTPSGVFSGFTALTKLILHGIKSLNSGFASYTESLIYVDLPNVYKPGTTTGQNFRGCLNLENINLPKLPTLYRNDFDGCVKLTKCSIPNVTLLSGTSIFNGCVLLNEISLNSLITISGNLCFFGCTALTKIEMPNVVSITSQECFSGTAITDLNLPKVTFLNSSVFRDMAQLRNLSLDVLINFPSVAQFLNCINLVTLSLPLCTNLGGTVLNDSLFTSVIGKSFTLTIPASRMTCNAGGPDGDIATLVANNTVTITQT
jgi:hypothetical protein